MNKKRILIVEDEPITAMNERQIIENLGYVVTDVLNSGEKVVSSVAEDTPDLVLMDINLGHGEDGIEIAEEIRNRFGVPVVFVTAHGNPDTLDRAKKSEPFGYVLKPFSREEMSATIEIALHKHKMEKKLHESEERFRAIADYSYDWEMWLGRDGKPRWINPAVERMTGYTVSACIEMTDYPLRTVHEKDREVVSGHLRKGRNEGFANDIEARIVCNNGNTLWVSFSYQPIYDVAGKFIGSRWSIRDISERKKMEAHLLDAKVGAEAANKAKSEFLTIMSHELRTPLNAINGFSEMMQMETLGPMGNSDYAGYADNINSAGKHLLQVINDLLDISKIEADAHELDKEDIDIHDIVNDSVKLVRGRATKANVGLSLDIPNDLPALFADHIRLKQILLNLLTNAIKFTPEKGQIIIKAAVDGNCAILLQVKDTGIGIAPENIPKIFKPFGQVDDVMVRNQEGTGLGIPLTKTLVELHGGSLEIESEVGKGTTVTASFPQQRPLSH